jgi:hypothetical protein
MMLTKRGKYLLYICLHGTAAAACALLLDDYGFALGRAEIYVVLLVATPFAVGAYLGILKLLEMLKQWRYRRGRDVYSEEAFEDDAGFIHINQKAAQVNKHEWELIEILGDSASAVNGIDRSDA